jgi:hypothetical protein
MSEIFTEQLTAVTNVVLAVFAIVTAYYAARAFGKQNEQIREQAAEQRKSQAAQVHVWQAAPTQHFEIGQPEMTVLTAHVHNTSPQPIYHLQWVWDLPGVPVHASIRVEPLMPDEKDSMTLPGPTPVHPFGVYASVTFQDRAGRWWWAHADGRLKETFPARPPQPAPPRGLTA